MFRLLRKIDDFIINRIFQPAVDFIWKLTGIDNFKLAKFLSVVMAIHGIVVVFSFEVLGAFLVVILFILFILSTNKFENSTNNNLANPARNNSIIIFWKVFFILFLAIDINFGIFDDCFSNIIKLLFTFVVSCERPTGKRFDIKNKTKNLFVYKSLIKI